MSNDKAGQATPLSTDEKRRQALKRIGRFAAATPPAVALLLAASAKPAKAAPLYVTDDVHDAT